METIERKAPITDAAARYAALRSHAIRLEEAIDPNAERVDKVGKMDVIFGRGKGLQKHPGNRRMRDIVDKHKVEYHESSRSEKKDMVVKVYNEIVQGGVRFLKKLDNENAWVLVDEPVAMEKVSHTLRCRKLLKGTIKDKKQQGGPTTTEEKSLSSGLQSPSINQPAIQQHTGQSASLNVNRAEMVPSLQGGNIPSYLPSLYGHLAGPPSASSSLGTLGAMGTMGSGASLFDLPGGASFSGVGAYGRLGNRPVIELTEMEYMDILRRRQQQALLLPQAHGAAMMQSIRLQMAANSGVRTAAPGAGQLSRESIEGQSGSPRR